MSVFPEAVTKTGVPGPKGAGDATKRRGDCSGTLVSALGEAEARGADGALVSALGEGLGADAAADAAGGGGSAAVAADAVGDTEPERDA